MSSSKHKEKPLQKSNNSGPEEKLRVLCLHGYRQNGNTFKSKIGKLSFTFQKQTESQQNLKLLTN